MPDPIVLSPTSLRMFLRCPQQWAFRHLERIVAPPPVKVSLGVAAHRAAEHNYAQKIESHEDEPEDVVLDVFRDTFQNETEGMEEPDEPLPKAMDQGVGLMRVNQREVAPRIQPAWVERATQFRLIPEHEEDCDGGTDCTCGVPFNATIDLVDERDEVHDLKTTGRTPSGGMHLMQVAAGAIGFEVETGRPAKDLVIDTLVRLKKPKYVEERWGGPVDSHMRRVFAQQVGHVMKMIKAGLFPTLGTGGIVPACSSCGYKPICPAWKRR